MKYKYNNQWNPLRVKPTGDTLPIGSITQYAGSIAPTNWLICDGSEVSRETYKDLFNAIGTTYGEGDGSTTFNLPDLRGKVGVGLSSDTEFNSLGKTGGEKTHKLTFDELAKHTHRQLEINTTNSGSWARVVNATADKAISSSYTTFNGITTGETGNDQPHNNLQPYLVTNYIIKCRQSVGVLGVVSNNITDQNENAAINAKTVKSYVDGKNIYSTEETIIGTFMGKPHYRKCYQLNIGTISASWKEITDLPNNTQLVTNIYGTSVSGHRTYPRYETSSWYLQFDVSNNKIKVAGAGYSNDNIIIILEYTKTTD